MAFLRIIQPPIDKETYDAVSTKVGVEGSPPDGLVLHCAGDADGSWQIVEIWDSQEHATRFDEARLGPVIGEVVGPDAPNRADAKITAYELHNLVTP
jgi:hypothetical protein